MLLAAPTVVRVVAPQERPVHHVGDLARITGTPRVEILAVPELG
jgi:hypothetical protein